MPRSILISGANQGLGFHTAQQLAAHPNLLIFMGSRKLAAADVAIAKFQTGIHASSSVVPVQLDITDDASVQAAQEFVMKFLDGQKLDVLMNNAGVAFAPIEQIYALNVLGTVRLTDAFRNSDSISPGGLIINVTSSLGSIASYTSEPYPVNVMPSYASSKAALNTLTVTWALLEQKKGSGIRVVSVDPGPTSTNLNGFHPAGADPAVSCEVMVKAALEENGRTAAFFNKNGDHPW
ncbi:Short-chain dehydrogenase/reductase family protein [Mycena kentingensis (nom. inval.)]|nr:Short-chain dehydrogenase/reductase family protein [Mycena kentingensis (nom. inval.)]